LSRIFIDRPIFAWVIAIVIMLAGLGGIFSLPIEQYPDVAPPQVNIRASYPGASAETIENSVTQIIEQQLTGIDGLLYFSSSSSSRGSVGISVVSTQLVRMTQVAHADLAHNITEQTIPTLDPTVLQTVFPVAGPAALAYINLEVNRQALFIAYLDDFKLMMIVTFAVLPLLLLMRRGKRAGGPPPHAAMD